MDTKKCSQCGNVKPISKFWKDNRRPNGLRAKCAKCMRVINKKAVNKYRSLHKRTDKSKASNEEFKRIRQTFLGFQGIMYTHIQDRITNNPYYKKYNCT